MSHWLYSGNYCDTGVSSDDISLSNHCLPNIISDIIIVHSIEYRLFVWKGKSI